ncbi:glycosyltransferase family 4 protein, partial [bacterium]|nr:glycosyltransferase family 4 protein [bacterium]
GMYAVPKTFIETMKIKAKIYEYIRLYANRRQVVSKRIRGVIDGASWIWAITEQEKVCIEKVRKNIVSTMLETGTNDILQKKIRNKSAVKRLKICWSGSHQSIKELPLLLYALSEIKDDEIMLLVLGDGPETNSWKEIADKLKLKNIIWYGRLNHSRALEIMSESDLLVHTSIREGTPHVVLEALSLGLPVICHNACGMGEVVNDKCGIKIPLINRDESIKDFINAILLLKNNPEELRRKSDGAYERAQELSWGEKVKEISQTYLRVLGEISN